MKKMIIYETTINCQEEMYGKYLNSDLLRIAVAINTLESIGIIIDRYNLSRDSQAFLGNEEIGRMIRKYGTCILPIIVVDGKVVKIKGYPTNKEICSFLGISMDILNVKPSKASPYYYKGEDY